jgi:hypothetical protein
MGTDYQGTKKRSSSLNEWQVKVCGAFSPLPISTPSPLHSSLLHLASFFNLPRFSLSPYPRVLAPRWLFFRFYLRSPRTLRWTIAILYRYHKKARERFLIGNPKNAVGHRFTQIFQRLKQKQILTFWVISVFPSAGSIVHDWTEMFGIVHGLCWFKTHSPVKPCGSICKIEPAQARRMG